MNIGLLTNMNDMLQSLLFVVFVNGMLTPKKSRLFTSAVFIAIVSGAFLLTTPFRVNFKPLIMLIVIVASVYLLYKDLLLRKIIVAGVLLLFVLLSEGIGILLFMFLSNFNFSLLVDYSIQRFIASVLFNMVFVSLSMLANIFINKFHSRIKRYLVVFLTGLPISFIILVMALFYNKLDKINEDILLLATLGMMIAVVTDIVIFVIVNTQETIKNEEKSVALMNSLHDSEYKYYKLALEEAQKAKKVKHDVLNQLQTIYSLFLSEDAKQKAAGVEMVESLKTRLENIRETVYCENHMVNIILTLKIQEARALGIDPAVSASIPEDIRIEKTDLCSIFSNILDNAIESCSIFEGPRKMEIKAGMKLNYLVIKVTNSCNEIERESEEEAVSLKKDGENHGLGLKIIADIVKSILIMTFQTLIM